MRPKHKPIRSYKEWWDKLHQLASDNDVKGFYSCYADYLDASYVESKERKLLRDMARKVANE